MLRQAVAVLLLLAAIGCGGAHRSAVGPVSILALPVEAEATAAPPPAPDESPAEIHHVVRPGQTLWRIAYTYGLSPEELAAANGIPDPTRIEVGTRLVIPGARVVREVPAAPTRADRAPDSAASSRPEDWEWPVRGGEILSYFGAPRQGHLHTGIDLRGPHGASVVAARDGRVTYSGSGMRGYGKTVMLDHGDGFVSLYAHNSALLVREGERVRSGEPIARVGRTGNATSDHCHFEIRRNDTPIDPLLILFPPFEARR